MVKGRSSHRKYSMKKAVLKNFAIFTGKYLCYNFFLIKLRAWRTGTLLKRDSNAGVFLRILRNSYEQLLWRTSVNGCFWKRGTDFLLMRFWSTPSRCMGISPFSSVDLFIRVLLLGYRIFYQEIYSYNPNYSFCLPPGWYQKNLVFDLILNWDLETYQMEVMTM